jgi:hypothetical protein
MLAPSAIEVDTGLYRNQFQEAACITDYQPAGFDWTEQEFKPRLARYVRVMVTPVPHFLEKGSFQAALGEIEVLR